MSLPRIKDFCVEDRPKARAIYAYMKDLLKRIAGGKIQQEQLVPLGEFFEAVEGQLTGEQAAIAEKIRELEAEEQTYGCNLCKREGLRENQVVWKGDDGWVCIYCAGLPEPFTPSKI